MQSLSRHDSAQPLYASSATPRLAATPLTQLQMHAGSLRQRASQSIASEQLCVPLGVTPRHDDANQHDANRVQSPPACLRQACSVAFCAQSTSQLDEPSRHAPSALQPAAQVSADVVSVGPGVPAGDDGAEPWAGADGDAPSVCGPAGSATFFADDATPCRRDPGAGALGPCGAVPGSIARWTTAGPGACTSAVFPVPCAGAAGACVAPVTGAAGACVAPVTGAAGACVVPVAVASLAGAGAVCGEPLDAVALATVARRSGGAAERSVPPRLTMIATTAPTVTVARPPITRPSRWRGDAAPVSTVRVTVAIVPVVGAAATPLRA